MVIRARSSSALGASRIRDLCSVGVGVMIVVLANEIRVDDDVVLPVVPDIVECDCT